MRVFGDIVFPLARLDATQATDAFGRIDAECPAMLCPVITGHGGDRRRAPAGCSIGVSHQNLGRYGGSRARDGASEQAQEFAACFLTLMWSFFHFAGAPGRFAVAYPQRMVALE
jgi:hypothetical protein